MVDGTKNFPKSWFYWIDIIKNTNKKYYVHLDEDFFITSKREVLLCLEKLNENSNILK